MVHTQRSTIFLEMNTECREHVKQTLWVGEGEGWLGYGIDMVLLLWATADYCFLVVCFFEGRFLASSAWHPVRLLDNQHTILFTIRLTLQSPLHFLFGRSLGSYVHQEPMFHRFLSEGNAVSSSDFQINTV